MVVQDRINTTIAKGSKILFQTLKQFGIDTVFGYPGGIVLDLYEELYNSKDIKHILVRHEQDAVHSADAYARMTNNCGVVIVTSGPGATNTVTGIVNAYLDCSPVIVITGQVFKSLIGKNAFQEANICSITKSCTKKVYQVTNVQDLQNTIIDAYKTAMSGKKGPVVVDVVKDVFSQNYEFKDINLNLPVNNNELNLSNVINLLNKAKKPVIVSGGGVNGSNAQDLLFNFATKNNIPVVDTMMGQGSFPQEHENYLGMIGIFGNNSANEILKESDLIISLGARFNDRIICKFTKQNLSDKIIQVDINDKEINNFIQPIDYVVADIKTFLSNLDNQFNNTFSKNWLNFAIKFKEKNVKRIKTSNSLHSFEIIQKLQNYLKDTKINYTTEVGQHQLWAIQNLIFNKKHKLVTSGGSGTMGFGIPAAIGCAIADKTTPVVCISGDGSFQMSMPELATCVENNLNIKILIMNNGYLGMVRQLQAKNCNSHYSQTKISNPDFVTLAKSYGINSVRVTKPEEIESALNLAFSNEKTFIIDFVIEPMEVL